MSGFRKIMYRSNGSKRAFVNMLIVACNILVFIVLEIKGSTLDTRFLLEHGAMYPTNIINQAEYYRFLTAMFMHYGADHLVNNMLVLYYLGDNLERAVGKIKYLIIYFLSGIAGSVLSVYMMYETGDYAVAVGASGAIFGVFGALFCLVIKCRGRMEDLTVKRLGIFIVLTLYSGYVSKGVDNYAHIGGLITGFVLALFIGKVKRKGVSKRRYEG